MAIRSKGRRCLTVDGQAYLWWIKIEDENDFLGTPVLSVSSTTRDLYLRYGLRQADAERFIVVVGPRFKGQAGLGQCWRRFLCPQFGSQEVVAPKDVAALVAWANDPAGDCVEVDWMARPLGGRVVAASTALQVSARKPT